ncbi:MAG: hypothetical protein KDC44_15625 [Phaeodactylibacter sp.]|nr:hypothetical protein [Phaeodactylibacter sp.]
MQIFQFRSIYFMLLVVILGISCTLDDDSLSNTTPSEVEMTVQSGTWKVTLFEEEGKNETYYFNGFSFTFEDNGTLIASNGSTTYEGSWSIGSGSNDDSPSDLDFNIFFPLSNEFEELNDDWDIVSRSNTRIELIDISGGNGGTDYLTFEKN